MITYKMLPVDEWDRLKPLFTKLFPNRPFEAYNPDMASVAVAEADGEIVGFWFLQLCAHAEPVGIDPDFRHGVVSLEELRNTIHEAYKGIAPGMEYYICAPSPEWDGPLTSRGFMPVGLLYLAQIPQKEGK